MDMIKFILFIEIENDETNLRICSRSCVRDGISRGVASSGSLPLVSATDALVRHCAIVSDHNLGAGLIRDLAAKFVISRHVELNMRLLDFRCPAHCLWKRAPISSRSSSRTSILGRPLLGDWFLSAWQQQHEQQQPHAQYGTKKWQWEGLFFLLIIIFLTVRAHFHTASSLWNTGLFVGERATHAILRLAIPAPQ